MLAALLASLLFTVQSAEPQITVQRDERPAVDAGELLHLAVTVDLPAEDSTTTVSLLPLGLQNFRLAGIDQRAEKLPGKNVRRHLFAVTLEALDAGPGTVDELQIEVTAADTEPQLLTWPGFTIQIQRPFRLLDHWLWLVGIGLVLATGAVFMLRRSNKQRDSAIEHDPERERRDRIMKEIERLRIRAEWRKIIEQTFAALLREAAALRGTALHGERLSEDDVQTLAKRWLEFPAAYRLGEEVRYGGFEPDQKEAGFMIGVLRAAFADLNENRREDNGTQE